MSFAPPDMQKCEQKCRCAPDSSNPGQVFDCQNPCTEYSEWDAEACECLPVTGTLFRATWIVQGDPGNASCDENNPCPQPEGPPVFWTKDIKFDDGATYLGYTIHSQSWSDDDRPCSNCENSAPTTLSGFDSICRSVSGTGSVGLCEPPGTSPYETQGTSGTIILRFSTGGETKGVVVYGGYLGGVWCCWPDQLTDIEVEVVQA